MKGKTKILALLMALAMILSLFAACTEKADDTSSTAADGSSTDAPKTITKLVWWHWGEQPKAADAVIKALNEKSKKDIGVEVEIIWATGDPTKTNTAVTTGAKDDVVYLSGTFGKYQTSAQQGLFADLTDMLKTGVGQDLYKFIPENVWKGVLINNKIYGVPAYKDVAGVYYWYCNKEYVFDKAGAEAEFMAKGERNADKTPLMKKLYDFMKAGNPYPHDLTAPYTYNFQGPRPVTVGDVGVQTDSVLSLPEGEASKLSFGWATPNYTADLKTLNEWFKAGYVNKDCETLQKEPEFCIINSAQGWEGAEITNWGFGKDYTVKICQRNQTPKITNVLGSVQGVFANSAHKEEAVKFIQYMNLDKEYRNMLCYGEEGVNWEDTGKGTVKPLNDDWKPGAWCQATFFTLKPLDPAPADMYDKMKVNMDKAAAAPTLGFVADVSKIQTQVAACGAVREKWLKQFQCGTMANVDAALESVQKEMKAAGWETVRDEVQKQLDAFLAAK